MTVAALATATAEHAIATRVCSGPFALDRDQGPRRSKHVEVANRTGPLDLLAEHDVLAIADAQNIDLGARDLGFKVSWKALGRRLVEAARSIDRHVFISQPPGSNARFRYFAERGWTAHVKTSRMVRTWRGWERRSNTDNLIAFFAGVLASRSHASLILICSGDANLVEDLAEATTLLGTRRPIVTLSLAGSTGYRLSAETSPFVAENIELGMDCLRPRNANRHHPFSHPFLKGGI